MADGYVVKGYACVFDQTTFVDGAYERIERNAFRTMLGRPTSIALRPYDHDASRPVMASSADGTLRLHADDHGLAFEATVAAEHGAVVRDVVTGRYSRCSVGLFILGSTPGKIGNHPLRVVHNASIDHVALVSDAAYATAAWADGSLHDSMPSYILNAAEQWEAGRAGGMSEYTAARLRAGRR